MTYLQLNIFQGFSWLVIFETGRDGTILTCLAGAILKTGWEGKIMKIIVAWMGQDGGFEFSPTGRDGTVQRPFVS